MDRQIVYPSAIPQDTDFLKQNKNTMIGLGYLMQAALGTSTYVDGLACTPTGPAGMTVNVGGGSIYALEEIDATAYGSIAADTTDQIVKQGIVIATQNFSCPAPATSGQSVVYLIEAAYQDVDGGSTVLPYYNASNPSQPYSGPSNTGTSQNTVRQGVCSVQVKTGVAATTGTQATPTPDAGYTGLYAITVANGQTTITSGNIVQLSTAPFIATKLGNLPAALQNLTGSYVADTSGAANTITIALNPAVSSLTTGQPIRVKIANTNTSAVVINTNALGNVSAVNQDGTAIPAGALQANGIYTFVYDGNHWQLQEIPKTQINKAYLTSGTSWTSPSNITASTVFKLTLLGGGGGGGGTGSGLFSTAGGGGSGAYAQHWISSLAASTAYTIAVGAGGTAGTNTGGSGGTGGTTSITINSTTYSVTGGLGGGGGNNNTNINVAQGGSGGTTISGSPTIAATGSPGFNGICIASAVSLGGHGGSSPFSAAGSGEFNAAGTPGSLGAGGGGAGQASNVGGAGGPGIILIEWVA